MSTLPETTLARLQSRAESGNDVAKALLHLIARADQRDQDAAKFVDSYSSTIAAICRRLEALERGANLQQRDEDAEAAQPDSVADTAQRITDNAIATLFEKYAAQAGLTVQDWAKAFNAAPTPRPTALVEVVGRELPRLPDGRVDEACVRFAIHEVAAWLATRGQHGCSALLREEINR